jgi:hypothetical protein
MAKDDKPATGDGKKDDDDTLGDAGKRALAAERDARRKAEADLKTARDELGKVKADQDTSKSDMQKVLDKVAGLEKRAEEAERKALVAAVAAEHKLTPGQARRLQGSTRDELEADAKDLLEAFGTKAEGDDDKNKGNGKGDDDGKGDKGDKPGIGRPKEKLRPGAAGDDTEGEIDRKKADELAKDIESGGFI